MTGGVGVVCWCRETKLGLVSHTWKELFVEGKVKCSISLSTATYRNDPRPTSIVGLTHLVKFTAVSWVDLDTPHVTLRGPAAPLRTLGQTLCDQQTGDCTPPLHLRYWNTFTIHRAAILADKYGNNMAASSVVTAYRRQSTETEQHNKALGWGLQYNGTDKMKHQHSYTS